MGNIAKLLPYALGTFIVWLGWDGAARIYEAYEAVCAKNIHLGCESISNDVVLLRLITLVCAITAGYSLAQYVSWSEKDRKWQRSRPSS